MLNFDSSAVVHKANDSHTRITCSEQERT